MRQNYNKHIKTNKNYQDNINKINKKTIYLEVRNYQK